jgi:hypothetical protein
MNQGKKKFISLAIAANFFMLPGCSSIPLTSVDPNTVNQEQEKSTGIKFSKVSPEKVNELNNFIARGLTPNSQSNAPVPAPSAMPLAAPTAAATGTPGSSLPGSVSPGGYGSSVETDITVMVSSTPGYPTAVPYYMPATPSPYYTSSPYTYFGPVSTFEEYTVVDFEEARKDGFSGSYLATLNNIIKPVISGLATDARLVSTYGSTDGNGKTAQPGPASSSYPTASPTGEPYYLPTPGPYYPGYNPYQWQFTYVSSTKKEVYSILVSPTETLILRQKWGLRDLMPQSIKIDSTEAIEIVRKAVRNKNTPDPQPSDAPYYSSNAEEIYDISESATINYDLQNEKDSLEWIISFSDNSNIEPNTSISGGYARVNAKTGELVYFHRMFKYTYQPYYTSAPYPDYSGNPYPYATPSAYDGGSGYPYGTPTPSPYACTTATPVSVSGSTAD